MGEVEVDGWGEEQCVWVRDFEYMRGFVEFGVWEGVKYWWFEVWKGWRGGRRGREGKERGGGDGFAGIRFGVFLFLYRPGWCSDE